MKNIPEKLNKLTQRAYYNLEAGYWRMQMANVYQNIIDSH